jgi:hypothetical protein
MLKRTHDRQVHNLKAVRRALEAKIRDGFQSGDYIPPGLCLISEYDVKHYQKYRTWPWPGHVMVKFSNRGGMHLDMDRGPELDWTLLEPLFGLTNKELNE